MRWIKKSITPFLMCTTSSITMQSLGKVVQRAPAVGAKMQCLFFCLFIWSRSESAALCVRGVHSSNKHCVAIYCPISTLFTAFFSEWTVLLDTLHSSHFRRQVAPQFSRNCGQKLRKYQKIGGKVCVHHFVQISDRFKENSNAVVSDGNCRCAPI